MIKVTKIKEHKDGSATLYFEYNSKILHPLVRKHYGKKRASKNMVKRLLREALVSTARKEEPRKNWEKVFKKMHKNKEDRIE